jgi:hypothetical protein
MTQQAAFHITVEIAFTRGLIVLASTGDAAREAALEWAKSASLEDMTEHEPYITQTIGVPEAFAVVDVIAKEEK